MKKGSMFQKTRIRLTILNSLVFIILIGVLGSIIYSYTYKRIYSGVNESIEKAVQHRKNADDKKLPKKIRGYPPIGDPRIMELTWMGNTVEIDIENGKRRFIFEDNLEKFSPKKLGTLQDIEVQGQYFRIFAFQKDAKIVQIARDITAEKFVKFPIPEGISPFNKFSFQNKFVKFVRFPISDGISPYI